MKYRIALTVALLSLALCACSKRVAVPLVQARDPNAAPERPALGFGEESDIGVGFRSVSVAVPPPGMVFNVADEFDPFFYLTIYPDVDRAIALGTYQGTPYSHYLEYGQFEGRSPNGSFDETWYRRANPDVVEAIRAGQFVSGFSHFLQSGIFEARRPNSGWLVPLEAFDPDFYFQTNPDVADAIRAGTMRSPLIHYVLYGQYERRSPSPAFNERAYLEANPDVAAAVEAGRLVSGLQHWVTYGRAEGRPAIR